MKTKAELDKDILEITSKIHNEFPELSKYIEEMPIQYTKSKQTEMATASLEKYSDSLNEMVHAYKKTHVSEDAKVSPEVKNLIDKLNYPASDDIYNQSTLASEVNPADPTRNKSINKENRKGDEPGIRGSRAGVDMDVPGSELDDQQETIGSEDEENNYYSLGGDAHNDLEERKSSV